MSISLSAITTTTTTSAFIDLQSPPRILISSARFFRLPPAAKTHLLRLCCTDSTHTSVSLSFFFNFFWLFLCVLSCSHPHWNCFCADCVNPFSWRKIGFNPIFRHQLHSSQARMCFNWRISLSCYQNIWKYNLRDERSPKYSWNDGDV